MRFTVSAKTCDLPHMEFSIAVDSLTEAIRIAKRLEGGFHDISVIEDEETGEVMYTRYQSVEVFVSPIDPEETILYAVTEYKQREQIL